ncbi:MAG: hypothetical protein J6M16_07655 [Clostridia bacterium]|nr:hypothetical protein [Clostridia bacterium]
MKNKKVFVTVIAAVCLVVLTSVLIYNHNQNRIKSQKHVESMTQAVMIAESEIGFDNTITNSTAAVTAEFISFKENDDFMTYKFKVIEILYGNVTESEIEFKNDNMGNGTDQYGFNSLTFNEGEKYIIPLIRRDDLFYEKPQYYFVGLNVIPYEKVDELLKENENVYKTVAEKYNGDLRAYFKETENKVGHSKETTKNIFRNESLETVVKNTDVLFKVKVCGVLTDGTEAPTTTYTCEVLESVNGVSYSSDGENGLIYVTCFKNSLEKDKEYIIALCRISDKSLIYTQAADNGIIPISDAQKVEQVRTWLSETE